MSIEAMKLTDPHDHPEPHTMKWTQAEMDYINNRVETAVRQAIEQAQQEPVAEKVGRITANVKHMVLRQEVMLYTDDYLPIGTAVYTSPPQRQPLLIGKESADFAKWFNAVWLGDGEQSETIPTSGKEYDEYLSQYTLAFGAWMAAKEAAHGIKE